MSENLGYSKKSAKWVPYQRNPEHKASHVIFCRQSPQRFKTRKNAAWKPIVTGDKTSFCNSDLDTKSESMVWSIKGPPPPKKFLRARSSGRTMFAIFFKFKGVVGSVPPEEERTANSKWYTEVCLRKFSKNYSEVAPRRKCVVTSSTTTRLSER